MDENKTAVVIASSHYEDGLLRQSVAPAQDASALACGLGNSAIGAFEVEQLVDEPFIQRRAGHRGVLFLAAAR